MATKVSTASLELSPELIQQYKVALGRVEDIRLVVLLLFNSFEDIMKSFAAWRVGCSPAELPKSLTNSSSLLFQLTLAGESPAAKALRKKTESLSDLRNTIAHGFHLRTYKTKIGSFVQAVSGKPYPSTDDEKRTAVIDAVYELALEVAEYFNTLPQRGNWPFPMLSVELAAEYGSKK